MGRGRAMVLATLVLGCGPGGSSSQGDNGFGTTAGTGTTSSPGGPTTGGSGASTVPTADSGGGSGTDPKFDLPVPDANGGVEPIPESCEDAEAAQTSIGCRFYAVDLDQLDNLGNDGAETAQYAVVISNVQETTAANVLIEVKVGNAWMSALPMEAIAPLDLHVFDLPDLHQEESGVLDGGAYRVTSDVPVIAYQFSPLLPSVSSASSDASLLFPVTAWDTLYDVVGWEPQPSGVGTHGAYVTVVAAEDDTEIEITPAVATLSGMGVPVGTPGTPFLITLHEGDIVEVMTKTVGVTMTGTVVRSLDDKPIGVFTASECSFVLQYACDHLEEQLTGLRRWGKSFVASRVPERIPDMPESSVWQIYASKDATQVTLSASANITGLPPSPSTLDRGQMLQLEVSGKMGDPGDFVVDATEPIAVLNYMTGSSGANGQGDPAMVQLAPVEQFLPRYVVLVPNAWVTDVAVITREPGSAVRIDGVEVPDSEFVSVGAHEVGRPVMDDGVHVLDGDDPFGVVIVGYQSVDSYGYLGGTGTEVINPEPEG